LERFSINIIPQIEQKISIIGNKIDTCDILLGERKVLWLGDILKGAASFEYLPKTKSKKQAA
jgi:hypothetical protein